MMIDDLLVKISKQKARIQRTPKGNAEKFTFSEKFTLREVYLFLLQRAEAAAHAVDVDTKCN